MSLQITSDFEVRYVACRTRKSFNLTISTYNPDTPLKTNNSIITYMREKGNSYQAQVTFGGGYPKGIL